MAQDIPIGRSELRAEPHGAVAEPRLARWLLYSLVLHLILIAVLLLSPTRFDPATRSYPVYSVDLVGGEKLGGGSFSTSPGSAPSKSQAPKMTQKAVSKPAPAAPVIEPKESKPKVKKVEMAKETAPPEKVPAKVKQSAPSIEKAKVAEAAPLARETVAVKSAPQKTPIKKEPAQESTAENNSDSASLESVRERILQSAVERARARSETAAKASKGEGGTMGMGDGEGAAAYGKGGRGGGTVRGIDFLIYQNRMLETIKSNWAWTGRGNLRVVVHFSIKDSGEIAGLKIVQPSGDSSYDESVLRAVRKSSPLGAPPESYRRDFADVELAFRPQDLGA